VLKNAIDSIFVTHALRNKPITAVSYSGGVAAGVRAIEHLVGIAVEQEMAPIRSTVTIGGVTNAFNEDGTARDPMTEAAMDVALDDLAWWASALDKARADGELTPGKFRVRAVMAARAAQ
jgi:NAD(P)H-dependent FMN reductase